MADEPPIFLDYQSTTPCDPRVARALSPYLTEVFGNPASRTHAFGWDAQRAVDTARAEVAALIGAEAREIVFTSGATEANNLAILGSARARAHGKQGRNASASIPAAVVTCATEHRAVLDPCHALEREGFHVTELPVSRDGHLAPEALRAAIGPSTVVVSLMHANNEIGVIHDVAALARVAHEAGALFHTDAAQSVGKIPTDVRSLGVDLLSFTAHKLYGPKGIGALYVRRGEPAVRIEPLIHGGGHERGLRSGTLPVPLVVGFGAACAIAGEERDAEGERLLALRERLQHGLEEALNGVHVNGDLERRLPGNLNLSFDGVEVESLLMALPDVALSAGSACTSAKPEPSHVLRALGLPGARAHAAARFGLGRFTTADQIDRVVARVAVEVQRLRAMSPAWGSRERERV